MEDAIKSFAGPGSVISSITLDETLTSHRRRRQETDNVVVVFLHFLLKFLKRKNQQMYCQARVIIAECAIRNKRGEDAYSNLTGAMRYRLRGFVGEEFWREAIDSFVCLFVEVKARHIVSENKVLQHDDLSDL